MDVIEKINQLEREFGEELINYAALALLERETLFEKLSNEIGVMAAVDRINHNAEIVGTLSYYKRNPTKYQTNDMEGFFHLREAFMLGHLNEKQVIPFLEKFI